MCGFSVAGVVHIVHIVLQGRQNVVQNVVLHPKCLGYNQIFKRILEK